MSTAMMTSKITKSTVVVVTRRDLTRQWLERALMGEAEVVGTDSLSAKHVAQLLEVTNARLAFVELSLDGEQLAAEKALMEALSVTKPMLPVIALGEGDARELILTAIRCGAADYAVAGSDADELRAMARQLLEHLTPRVRRVDANHGVRGRLTVVLGARPSTGAGLLCAHLGLALHGREPGQEALILDLGLLPDDVSRMLDVEPTYTFADIVRNIQSIDRVLINTAFPRHGSGVMILGLGEDAGKVAEITSSDIYIVIDALMHYFGHVIINLTGITETDFVSLFTRRADHLLLLVDQTVINCQANRLLYDRLKGGQPASSQCGLVIENYARQAEPGVEALAQGFRLPVYGQLPVAWESQLRAINAAKSLFDLAPKDPYVSAIGELARVIDGEVSATRPKGLLQRLLGR